MLTDNAPAVDDRQSSAGVWMSLGDLAKREDVSKQAISKRVKGYGDLVETKLVRRELFINVVQFDRAAGDNTDPAQALRNGKAEPEDAQGPAPRDGSYSAARAARESYQAESARLDLQERLGRLVEVAEVDRRTFGILRRCRDRVLAVPALLADRLAAAPDARAIRGILDDELRKIMMQLAADFDGGVDEGDADDDVSPAA